MLAKLESKTSDTREKENFISDMLNIMAKFQAQFNVHDELVRMKSTAKATNNSFINQQLLELYSRLGIAVDSAATPTSTTTTTTTTSSSSTTTRKSFQHRDSLKK